MTRSYLLPPWENLSLEQKIAQLLVVRASGYPFDDQRRYPQWEAPGAILRHWIEELGVGGVILLGGSACDIAVRTEQLQSWSQVPLFMAADIEEGVGQRFPGATELPPPMALWEIAQVDFPQARNYARQMGIVIAQEAQAIGLNWLLAPVVDVNNNPKNPVINVRAFGETPEIVIPLIESFIQGCQVYPVLTTAKHFPGHGDTAIDSHLQLPCIPHPQQRLHQIELAPFRAAIAAGVSTVMTAHLQVPALDSVYPATLSQAILTQLLRQEMGFDGLIVTDALIMQAITQHYGKNEAPIMALEAGADVILMPVDVPGVIAAICAAVKADRLSLERIHHSLGRIWRAKQQIFEKKESKENTQLPDVLVTERSQSDSQDLISQPFTPEALAKSQALDLCQTLLRRSQRIQLPKISGETKDKDMTGRGSQLESTPENQIKNGLSLSFSSGTNLIIVDNLLGADFLGIHTPAVQLPQTWGYQLRWVDRQTPFPAFPAIDSSLSQDKISHFQPTLLQVFIRDRPFQGSAPVTTIARSWLQGLVAAQQLQALIFYGSPYVWEEVRSELPPDIPAVFSYGQMPMAQRIALEELFKLRLICPVTTQINPEFTT